MNIYVSGAKRNRQDSRPVVFLSDLICREKKDPSLTQKKGHSKGSLKVQNTKHEIKNKKKKNRIAYYN